MAVQLQRRLFTVAEYHQMIQAGVFGEDDRLELVDGELVAMTPINPRHAGHVKRLASLFQERLGKRAIISVQDPVRLDDHSEPQPDIALLRPRSDYYTQSHPGPEDILLIVEVSDSSADYDRTVKIPAYARAGITEAWLVSLVDGQVEVYRDPVPQGYHFNLHAFRGEKVAPQAFPEVQLEVGEIIP